MPERCCTSRNRQRGNSISGRLSIREAAVRICVRVFNKHSYADILLEQQAVSGTWSGEDLSLLYEIVNGSIRRKETLEYWLSSVYHGNWHKLPDTVRWILITALYQMRFLDRIPAFAAVNEAVTLAGQSGDTRLRNIVNAVLRTVTRNPKLLEFPEKTATSDYLRIRFSLPEWLISMWIDDFGFEKTEALCRAANARPSFGIRVNTHRITRQEAASSLIGAGIEIADSPLLPEFLTTGAPARVPQSRLFQEGCISLQDVSAGFAANLASPEEGQVILDAASAPGGKATHLSELSEDRCVVLAMDRNYRRLQKVISYRNRLGIKKLFPILGDGAGRLPVTGPDTILLDVPCSGSGVLSKRAELRWHKNASDVDDLVAVQKRMALQAADAL